MNNSKYTNPYINQASPSLYKDPKISDTIKENKDFYSVEIEKNEIVAKPGLAGLHKAIGKTHGQGGIKAYLEPESFVFSNDKSLAFTKHDHDVMELKKGGYATTSWKVNTPAEVLKRNIDLKHYNTLLNNLDDIDKDDLAKQSSILMLSKYQNTLGKIAYLQEAKKGFETGVPDFAQDTAPVYDTDTKKEIKEQPQYMKYGGNIDRYGLAGTVYPPIDKYPGGRTMAGRTTPTGRNNAYAYPGGLTEYLKAWRSNGLNLNSNMDNSAVQGMVYDKLLTENPDEIKNMWSTYGNTAKGKKLGLGKGYDFNNLNNDQLKNLKNAYVDGLFGVRQLSPHNGNSIKITQPIPEDMPAQPIVPSNDPQPELENKHILPYNPYVGFSPEQMANMGYAGLEAAAVKRYLPYRQQQRSPLVEQEYYNAQPALNQVAAGGNQAFNVSKVLNPYLANAANMETQGKVVSGLNDVIGQYAERNVGVGNRQNEMNNQIQRTDMGANMQYDKQYYDSSVAANQNFDDLKSVARNNFIGLTNDYLGENRQLQEFLQQQPIAGSVPIKDKNGKIIGYREQPLYDYNSGTGRVFKTGAGNILNVNGESASGNTYLERAYNTLLQKALDGSLTKEQAIALNSLDNYISSKSKNSRSNPYN